MRTTMIAMIAAATLAAPAIATETVVNAGNVQRSVVEVRYGDLDLAAPAGRAELDRRVARAVNRVCGLPVPSDPIPTVTAECRSDAFAGADRQIAALGASAASGAGSFAVGAR